MHYYKLHVVCGYYFCELCLNFMTGHMQRDHCSMIGDSGQAYIEFNGYKQKYGILATVQSITLSNTYLCDFWLAEDSVFIPLYVVHTCDNMQHHFIHSSRLK